MCKVKEQGLGVTTSYFINLPFHFGFLASLHYSIRFLNLLARPSRPEKRKFSTVFHVGTFIMNPVKSPLTGPIPVKTNLMSHLASLFLKGVSVPTDGASLNLKKLLSEYQIEAFPYSFQWDRTGKILSVLKAIKTLIIGMVPY